jgi:hypothetical protein
VGVDGRALLYQIICLQNTPPVNPEEQDLCMRKRKVCWRLTATRGRRRREDRDTADPTAEAASEAAC